MAHRTIYLKKVLSSSIIPGINQILKRLDMTLRDIDGFAIGLGPGSFTSLRVGLATVKAFCLATGKPAVGVPSLDVLAGSVQDHPADQICAIVDARRNKVYACVYEKKGKDLRKISDYMLTSVDDVLDRVRGRTLFVGDGLALYRDLIIAKYEEAAGKKKAGGIEKCTPLFTEEKFWYPPAGELAKIAYQRFRKNDVDPADQIVPLYLYPEDCQVTPLKAGSCP